MKTQTRVRLPRLLEKELNSDGATLKERARLNPGNVRINLNVDPLSTVEIRIPERDPDVAIHDFAEVYNQHGSVGIYRVVGIQPDYGKGRVLSLNHALDTLNDAVFPGDEKFDGTVTAYLTKLLNAQKQTLNGQKYWQLGTVEDTGTWSQELSYDNVLELVQEIPAEHQEYMYTYDFSVFPWRLNLVRKSDTVLSEFRANRNIESCKVSVDDSELCTRVHMSVTTYTTSSSGRKSTVTFETHDDLTAQAEYGIVEKTVGIDTDKVPASQKAAWIADYFQRHNAPTVQISVDGADLKEQTGVSIDEMHLGYLCRVALPRYNTLFNERIVTITYPDALRRPTLVSVSLANKRQTTEDSIASAQKEAKKASKSGGGAKQKAENNETTIKENQVIYNRTLENTDKRIRSTMTATGVLLDENNEPLIGPDGLYVFDTTGPGAALSSRVTQMAGKLESEITARTAQGENLSSRITQTATAIESKVSAGDIASTINQTAQSVLIQASKINLEGYVTASSLASDIADLAEVSVNNINGSDAEFSTGDFGLLYSDDARIGALTLNGNSVTNMIVSASVSGNVLTLTPLSGSPVTFSKATTLNGGWSSGAFTVTATQNNTDVGSIVTALTNSGHWGNSSNGENANYYYGATYATVNGSAAPVATGNTYSINASGRYTAGETAGKGAMGLSGSWASNVLTVTAAESSTKSVSYTIGVTHSLAYHSDTHDFTITSSATANGATVKTETDNGYGSIAYTKGFEDGEAQFTQATVTPEGTAYGSITPISATSLRLDTESITPINSSSAMHLGAETTIRPCSGSAITPTLAKVKVATSNGTYYLRKTSAIKLKHWGSQTFYAAPTTGATSYNHDWYYIDTGGTNYYQSDGTATKYSVADASFYDVGSSNAGKTLYEGGTSNTYRRVLDSGGTTFYTADSAVTRYKTVSSGGTVYYTAGTPITDLRNPGTQDTTTYYTKSSS